MVLDTNASKYVVRKESDVPGMATVFYDVQMKQNQFTLRDLFKKDRVYYESIIEGTFYYKGKNGCNKFAVDERGL